MSTTIDTSAGTAVDTSGSVAGCRTLPQFGGPPQPVPETYRLTYEPLVEELQATVGART